MLWLKWTFFFNLKIGVNNAKIFTEEKHDILLKLTTMKIMLNEDNEDMLLYLVPSKF